MTAQPPGQREQHAVANHKAETLIDVLEAVDVDEHHGGSIALPFLCAGDGAADAIDEELAVRQPRQIVMHRVVHQPLMRPLEIGHVTHQTDTGQKPGIVAFRRAGAEFVPNIGAIMAAAAGIDLKVAATVLLERPQHQLEALAVGIVQMLQELLHRGGQRPRIETERLLDLARDTELAPAGIPLPDRGAGAIDRERLDLHLAWWSELHRRAAGASESELRHGEAEQDKDEDEAGNEARDDNLAGELAEHNHGGAEQPNQEQHPAWNQRQCAVLAAKGEIDDETGTDAGDENGGRPG